MRIGIPKELKNHEYRVGATPHAVKALVDAGHEVWIQKEAGTKIGFTNEEYERYGAKIVPTLEDVYQCEMIYKVKEPQAAEFPLMKEGQVLFCYLHLAPDLELTKSLLNQKVLGVAFETVTDSLGRLPLLTPMSEVAGRIAIQEGSHALQMAQGGKGVLLGGVPGVPKGKVIVIGGGVVGTEAMRMAIGLGAEVKIFDTNLERLRDLDKLYSPSLKTAYSTKAALEESLVQADLVVGAVLIPGAKAPKIVSREMLKKMQPGSVIVDVAIDQGGCFETAKGTTHSDPTYVEEGVVHYCVTNMPAACSRTATQALCNATLPFALQIANKGVKRALEEDQHLLEGLNVSRGRVTNSHVAKALGYDYLPAKEALASEKDL